MKVQFVAAAALAMLTLTACGGKHEKVYAVDKLAEAEAAALEKAPKAEEVKFDDHGQPPFAAVAADAPATDAATTEQPAAEAKSETTTEAASANTEQPAETDKAAEATTESK